MTDVGVRELKARLSEYLKRAAEGEVIRVTDRGRPRALLSPLPGRVRLDQGIDEGWVRPPAEHRPGPWKRQAASRSIADVMAEDREG